MKITFEEENADGRIKHAAISQLVKYRGRMRDELLWATIQVPLPKYPDAKHSVTWEDEWNLKLCRPFDSLKEAKQHVLDNYSSHEPEIIGPSWDE